MLLVARCSLLVARCSLLVAGLVLLPIDTAVAGAAPAPTQDQIDRWTDWIETRAPSSHTRGGLQDSEGTQFDCVAIEYQPSFNALALARARHAALLVDEGVPWGDVPSPAQVDDSTDQWVLDGGTDAKDISPLDALVEIQAVLEETGAERGLLAEAEQMSVWSIVPMDEPAGIDISGACDDGYIPIRHWTVEQIAPSGSLEAFLSSEPPYTPPWDWPHEHASVTEYRHSIGAAGTINVWNPDVQQNSEFSLMQMWVVRGNGWDRQTVEVGWQDFPNRTFSSSPKFFVFSTSNGYHDGWCYDFQCGRWTQLSSALSPGMGYANHSVWGGPQHASRYTVWRGSSGNWYVYADAISGNVGYYSSSLFDSAGLGPYASKISLGGEVYVDPNGTRHSTTDMGSGNPPSDGWSKAAYIRKMKVRDTSLNWNSLNVEATTVDKINCYSEEHVDLGGSFWGSRMYLGGSGSAFGCLP